MQLAVDSALPLFATLTLQGMDLPSGRADHAQVVCREETPVPPDVWPSRVPSAPTGCDMVPPSAELVRGAIEYQRALAVIPISAADERLIEDYIRDHAPARTSAPIRRRISRPS